MVYTGIPWYVLVDMYKARRILKVENMNKDGTDGGQFQHSTWPQSDITNIRLIIIIIET